MARKKIEVNDLSGSQYSINESIRFKSRRLRLNLWDHSDAYIVVKGTLDLEFDGNNDMTKKILYLNNTPSKSCISKMSIIFIDNAEDLNAVMSIYNLLE